MGHGFYPVPIYIYYILCRIRVFLQLMGCARGPYKQLGWYVVTSPCLLLLCVHIYIYIIHIVCIYACYFISRSVADDTSLICLSIHTYYKGRGRTCHTKCFDLLCCERCDDASFVVGWRNVGSHLGLTWSLHESTCRPTSGRFDEGEGEEGRSTLSRDSRKDYLREFVPSTIARLM